MTQLPPDFKFTFTFSIPVLSQILEHLRGGVHREVDGLIKFLEREADLQAASYTQKVKAAQEDIKGTGAHTEKGTEAP